MQQQSQRALAAVDGSRHLLHIVQRALHAGHSAADVYCVQAGCQLLGVGQRAVGVLHDGGHLPVQLAAELCQLCGGGVELLCGGIDIVQGASEGRVVHQGVYSGQYAVQLGQHLFYLWHHAGGLVHQARCLAAHQRVAGVEQNQRVGTHVEQYLHIAHHVGLHLGIAAGGHVQLWVKAEGDGYVRHVVEVVVDVEHRSHFIAVAIDGVALRQSVYVGEHHGVGRTFFHRQAFQKLQAEEEHQQSDDGGEGHFYFFGEDGLHRKNTVIKKYTTLLYGFSVSTGFQSRLALHRRMALSSSIRCPSVKATMKACGNCFANLRRSRNISW